LTGIIEGLIKALAKKLEPVRVENSAQTNHTIAPPLLNFFG
jgi:hypothetical protein